MIRRDALAAGDDYRPDIDGLRAVAVLMVISFHAFPAYFRHGYIGVDVFFVISGYLITGILLRNQGTDLSHLSSFYARRIRRIFPALLAVLVSTSIAGYLVLLPAEFRALDRYLLASTVFISNVVAWTASGYFEKAAQTTPLLHLWSLAIEEQFYIVWPLLLWWLARRSSPRRLGISLAIAFTLSFAFGLLLTYSNQPLAYYHPLARAWELIAGAWLAWRVAEARPLKFPVPDDWAVALALGLLAVCGGFLGNAGAFPGVWALVPVLCSTTLIACAPGSWAGRQLLAHPVLVRVGRISYPLYLWHWVALAFLRIEYPSPPWPWTLGAVVSSFGLAVATYCWVEQPVQRRPIPRVVPGLVAAMALVLGMSYADYRFNIAGKHQTELQIALEKEYDPRPAYRYGTCFLDSATQQHENFAPMCIQPGRSGDTRVLLWGDSLAAQLYPGLHAVQDSLALAISQRTASSCPPSVGSEYPDRGHCDAINASTRELFREFVPDVVIINGRWGERAAGRIEAVVRFLQTLGVRKIVLVGPTPDWLPDLRGLLSRTHFPGGRLPEYQQPPPDAWRATRARTEELREIAKSLQVEYLAPQDLLCQDNACRIKVSEDLPDGLIASDHDHLTAQASEFLFRDARATAVIKP